MKDIPFELLNIIFSYVERPATNKLMKYVINECYEEDHDPYYAENWYDNYCFNYSFSEWYFMYRKRWVNVVTKNVITKNVITKNHYKHTPAIIAVGFDKVCVDDRLLGFI